MQQQRGAQHTALGNAALAVDIEQAEAEDGRSQQQHSIACQGFLCGSHGYQISFQCLQSHYKPSYRPKVKHLFRLYSPPMDGILFTKPFTPPGGIG